MFKSLRLYLQDIEDFHVSHLPIDEMDKRRNINSKSKKARSILQLLSCCEWCPIELVKVNIYRCRVKRENRRV